MNDDNLIFEFSLCLIICSIFAALAVWTLKSTTLEKGAK